MTYFLHTDRGALSESDRAEQHHEAVAAALRRSDDGDVVHGRALGNLIAGLVAGLIETLPLPQLFGTVFVTTAGAGLLLLVASPFVSRMIGDVR